MGPASNHVPEGDPCVVVAGQAPLFVPECLVAYKADALAGSDQGDTTRAHLSSSAVGWLGLPLPALPQPLPELDPLTESHQLHELLPWPRCCVRS